MEEDKGAIEQLRELLNCETNESVGMRYRVVLTNKMLSVVRNLIEEHASEILGELRQPDNEISRRGRRQMARDLLSVYNVLENAEAI